MDEFGPLLILILVWIFVGLPAAMAKKVKQQKTVEKLSGFGFRRTGSAVRSLFGIRPAAAADCIRHPA